MTKMSEVKNFVNEINDLYDRGFKIEQIANILDVEVKFVRNAMELWVHDVLYEAFEEIQYG